MNNNASVFEKHPALTLITFFLLIFLGFDLVLGRYIFPLATHSEESYRIKSPYYHHDLARNVDIDNAVWGGIYSLSTNSLGFKDSHVRDVPITSDKRRMLFIGDSFTEGVGFSYKDTFVGQISATMKEKEIEVLNAGVSSYSPTIYYSKLKYLLEVVKLQVSDLYVFIDISDMQDETIYRWNSEYYVVRNDDTKKKLTQLLVDENQGFSTKIKKVIQNNSYTFRWLQMLWVGLKVLSGQKPWGSYGPRSLWTINDEYFEKVALEGLPQAKTAMDKIVSLSQKFGIKLTIGVYPWPAQIFHRDLESRQVSIWKTWALKHNVSLINYFPCFINDSPWQENVMKYFLWNDVHWNIEGHKLIAKHFMSHFLGKDSLCLTTSTPSNP